MMRPRHFLVVIAVLMAVAVGVQVRRDAGWQAYDAKTPVMWLQAGPATERATLGYDALVSDIYWMRAVVYFGRQRLSQVEGKTYDLLYPYLNLVTSLDPQFTVAYRFGAIFLSEQYPDGPHRPDQAIALLQRGIKHNPLKWEYPHDIAFVYYFSYQNFPEAAAWFERASQVPGAPVWLRTMAAVTLARGGERDASRLLWRELYEGADNESIQENALIRLAQLDTFDILDELNPMLWRYKARTGRFPLSWDELIAAGVLHAVPTDTTGEPFILHTINEDARISRKSKLWPVPEGMDRYGQ
jgi:tetratricopeptide (TPR) repeat protein